MNENEKDRLIEILKNNIAEKEKHLLDLIRENVELKRRYDQGEKVDRNGKQ